MNGKPVPPGVPLKTDKAGRMMSRYPFRGEPANTPNMVAGLLRPFMAN